MARQKPLEVTLTTRLDLEAVRWMRNQGRAEVTKLHARVRGTVRYTLCGEIVPDGALVGGAAITAARKLPACLVCGRKAAGSWGGHRPDLTPRAYQDPVLDLTTETGRRAALATPLASYREGLSWLRIQLLPASVGTLGELARAHIGPADPLASSGVGPRHRTRLRHFAQTILGLAVPADEEAVALWIERGPAHPGDAA